MLRKATMVTPRRFSMKNPAAGARPIISGQPPPQRGQLRSGSGRTVSGDGLNSNRRSHRGSLIPTRHLPWLFRNPRFPPVLIP